MLRPKKNSYKEFDNEKKFLRLKNSPPPPITFLMVRPLIERIHVYRKRQTSDSSGEFPRIENKQIKTVPNDSYG